MCIFFREGGRSIIIPNISLRVYNMLTVPTISRLRLLGADSVYRLQTCLCAKPSCAPPPVRLVAPSPPPPRLRIVKRGVWIWRKNAM